MTTHPTTNRTSWREQALCVQVDTEVFFPSKGGDNRQAKAVCRRCPVAVECLDEALSVVSADDYGIWGGTGPRQRRQLRQMLTDATPTPERTSA